MATPTQVVDSIKQITQKSQALQEPAQTISIVNGPLLMVGQGPYPPIIHGLSDIVNTTQTSFPQMIGMKQVAAGKDADAIHDAFREVTHFPRPSGLRRALLTHTTVRPGQQNALRWVGQES
jgi:hypothetical protein